MKVTCKKCQRSWTGEKACHCGGCHRHFVSLRVFDAHQPAKQGWVCQDPPSKYFHQDANGVWRYNVNENYGRGALKPIGD